MESISGFLQQAYWWLSLLGGIHCAVLAGLLGRKSKSHNRTQQAVVIAIFATLSVYFLTGIINRENAPLPIHIILALITPVYFLLMPLVYFYCKNELDYHQRNRRGNLTLHYGPAVLVALTVLAFTVTHFHRSDFLKSEAVVSAAVSTFSLLGMVLPALLLLQTAGYAVAIIKVIRLKRGADVTPPDSADDLKVRWLLALAVAIIINWLIRCLLASFSLFLGEQYWLVTETLVRFNLLITLYILAIYRLQQLTVIAYQNGLVARVNDKKDNAITDVLDSDEKEYLSSILSDKEGK